MRKISVLLGVGVLTAGLLLALAFWWQREALQQPLQLSAEQFVDVAAGATPGGVLNRLQAEGVLQDAFWLRLYWRFNLAEHALHSGEYRLTPGMTASELLTLWQRGEVVQYSLTLVEGWNFQQVRSALARQDKLVQEFGRSKRCTTDGAPGARRAAP